MGAYLPIFQPVENDTLKVKAFERTGNKTASFSTKDGNGTITMGLLKDIPFQKKS